MHDDNPLREIVLRCLEDARRVEQQWQTVLDAIDAGCVSVSGFAPSSPVDDESDFDPANLISTGEAAILAKVPKDTIRHWCRECGIGRHKGGRWLVSQPRLLRHIGQG